MVKQAMRRSTLSTIIQRGYNHFNFSRYNEFLTIFIQIVHKKFGENVCKNTGFGSMICLRAIEM